MQRARKGPPGKPFRPRRGKGLIQTELQDLFDEIGRVACSVNLLEDSLQILSRLSILTFLKDERDRFAKPGRR